MNGNDNLPPGLTVNEDHIQGGDPRFDAEAERFALALGDQLDALYNDHQEEIIRLGTEHILLRLDEEAAGPGVIDLSDMDAECVSRIVAALDEWKRDPSRCLAMTVLDGHLAERVPRVLEAMDAAPDAIVLILQPGAFERLQAGEQLGLNELVAQGTAGAARQLVGQAAPVKVGTFDVEDEP